VSRAVIRRSLLLLAIAAIFDVATGADGDGDVATAPARDAQRSADPASGGIWKAVVPPAGTMHGEFDSYDPLGLAAGGKIKADCSINWVDPDTGALYCFASATSLVFFLDAPHAGLERARAQWLRLGAAGAITERRVSSRDPSTRSAAPAPSDRP
jgi:hypothetical protein